jgi:hypothetical protein
MNIGDRYGMLVCIGKTDKRVHRNIVFKFKCDCGNIVERPAHNVKRLGGKNQSCGCLKNKIFAKNCKRYRESEGYIHPCFKHGQTWRKDGRAESTRLYRIWHGMKSRCDNPKVYNYHRYGGRGVQYCTEWEDFVAFRDWAMSNGYTDELTIERVNNDYHYCPENCKWILPKEQYKNRSYKAESIKIIPIK